MFLVGAGIIFYGMVDLKQPIAEFVEEAENGSPKASRSSKPSEPEYTGPVAVNLEIEKGETLSAVLQNQGVDIVEVALVVESINSVFDLRKLKTGQEIFLELEKSPAPANDSAQTGVDVAANHIKKISFQPNFEDVVNVEVDKQGEFVTQLEKIDLDKMLIKAEGEIENSFYQSLLDAGVPDNVTLQVIAALSFAVDFQRDIQPGKRFEVVFDAFTKDGEIVKGKRPAYAKLELDKKTIEIFVRENENGALEYFYPNAENVKRGLLRTPINGARITSGFGKRKHPILGYSKMHKGVDFGAPTGTPIYAAGDGKIVELGRKGGYGNYIRVRHNETYQTAYAHISRFAKSMRNGTKVRQGQVIAYVGTTGRSTGPHLHFEVLKNGAQINPQNAKFNLSQKLVGKALASFNAEKSAVLKALKAAPTAAELKKQFEEKAALNTAPAVVAAPAEVPIVAAPVPEAPTTPMTQKKVDDKDKLVIPEKPVNQFSIF